MDKYFYEFWENQLINLDKGQKQMEDMTRWIMQGLSSFEELSGVSGKFYSMDFWTQETHDYLKAWEMTTQDFQKFFKDYLDLIGLVPRDEHLTLISKYKDLNETISDQQEEISKQKKMVADQKKEIADKKKLVTDQKKEIANQKKLVADLRKEIADQKKIAADQQKEISQQKKLITDQQKKIAEQKKRVDGLQKDIAGHKESIK